MQLTPEYKKITAIFDSPIEIEPGKDFDVYHHPSHRYHKGFRVGPVEYLLTIDRDSRDLIRNNYLIAFQPKKIHAKNDKELAEIYSRALGRYVDQSTVAFYRELHEHQGNGYGYGVLKLGNSARVLGTVARLIEDFIETHPVDCLRLDAYEESRIDLYRAMLRRLARGARVYEVDHPETDDRYSFTEFNVCFDEPSTRKRKDDKNQQYLPLS
jgi:hypothetical protein